VEEREPSYTVGGKAKRCTTVESSVTFLKKLKIEVHDPAIPLRGIYPKEKKTTDKDVSGRMFTAALSGQPGYGNNLSVRGWAHG